LDGVLSIIAAEDEQVLDRELLCFGPADLQTRLLHLGLPFELLCVQQVKHFLIVDL